MDICIKNCILISMNKNRKEIEENIDILIKDDKIIKIDRNIEVSEETKIIDATGRVVMPGLINTHAHVPMSIFRETLDGYNLQDWLSKKIFPMEDKLTHEDIYNASCLTYLEMIKTGTTTINDMYFMTEDIIKAAEQVGIRIQTTRALTGNAKNEEDLKRIEQFVCIIEKYKNISNRITFNLGIHGLYTTEEEYIKRCLELAKKYNLLIHMHFCENSKEVDEIRQIYNKEPIEELKDQFKNVKMILSHCVKMSKRDIEEIAKMNISVSHCPVSNLKLGCGIASVSYMKQKGINVSLGTDGQGSGSNLDLFETMKYTALLQKGINENPQILSAYEVLEMATINGAKALGLEKYVGSIEEGKLADIIIIDINDIKIKPVNNLISEIVYNVKSNNVVTTIVDGRILMEERKLVDNIEKDIVNKCEEIIKRINTEA